MSLLKFIDTSFLPDKDRNVVENIKLLLKEQNISVNKFSLRALRDLSVFSKKDYKKYTLNIEEGTVFTVFPKDITFRRFVLYVFFENNSCLIVIKDELAGCIIKSEYFKYDEELRKTEELFVEKDFFRERLIDFININVKKLFEGLNISDSDIYSVFFTGISIYIDLLYDIQHKDNDSIRFINTMPCCHYKDIGINIAKNAVFYALTGELFYNNTITFITNVLKERYNDFIFIYEDYVCCYNKKENTLIYISGVFEQELQNRLVKYYKEYYIELPIDVINMSKEVHLNSVKHTDLSLYLDFDNINKVLFDIGKLGLW